MVKLRVLLLEGLIILGVFNHCSDGTENDRLKTESKFVYNGKEYPLTNGYMGLSCATPTYDSSFYAIDVYLFSSDVGFTSNCPGFNVVGPGNGIFLGLLSKSPTELTSGIYAEPGQSNLNDEKLNSAILYEYVSYPGAGGGSFIPIEGMKGSVSVSKSELDYTITLNLITVPGFGEVSGAVTGRFIGELEVY